MLMLQRGTCRLFELFAARRSRGVWHAGSGAIFKLRSNRLRPRGWTSADAAGLPILPELDDAGAIRHALRFTVSRTRRAFVFPARHFASPVIARALKRYGMLGADHGSDWFITGAPDRRRDDDALHTLARLHGSGFEVVSEASPRAAAAP